VNKVGRERAGWRVWGYLGEVNKRVEGRIFFGIVLGRNRTKWTECAFLGVIGIILT
jgi:hypothetical protein